MGFGEGDLVKGFVGNVCKVGEGCNGINATTLGSASNARQATVLQNWTLTYNTTTNTTHATSSIYPNLQLYLPGSSIINWNSLPCMQQPPSSTRRHCQNQTSLLSVQSTPKSRFESFRNHELIVGMNNKTYNVIGWQTSSQDFAAVFGYDGTSNGGDTFVGGTILVNVDGGQRILISFTKEYTIRTSQNRTSTAPPAEVMTHLQQAAWMNDAEILDVEWSLLGMWGRSGMVKVFTVDTADKDIVRFAQCEINSNDFRTGGTGGIDDDVETYAHWSRCVRTEMKIHILTPFSPPPPKQPNQNCTIPDPLIISSYSNVGHTCFPLTIQYQPDSIGALDIFNIHEYNHTSTSVVRVLAGRDRYSNRMLVDANDWLWDSFRNHTYDSDWAKLAKEEYMVFADKIASAVEGTTGVVISGDAMMIVYVVPAVPIILILIGTGFLALVATYIRFTTPVVFLAHWTEVLAAAVASEGGRREVRTDPAEEVDVDVKVRIGKEGGSGEEVGLRREEGMWVLVANGVVVGADDGDWKIGVLGDEKGWSERKSSLLKKG